MSSITEIFIKIGHIYLSMEETNTPTLPEIKYGSDKESIELTKNTKGYNWSVKIKSDSLTLDDIKRLEELEAELNIKWGYSNE